MDPFIEKVKKQVEDNKIMLFIKGTKDQPMCGFSAKVVEIFNQLGKPYATADVLSDPELRSRMEEFSHWPTFPQVFIKGDFVGGCDIVMEMLQNNELQPLVEDAFKK
jgi:monothiol glutaredoxin